MIDTVDVSWHQFVASIKNQMQLIDPGIIPYFEGSSAAIDHIRKEVHDRMKEAIEEFGHRTRRVHSTPRIELYMHLRPFFKQALQIRGI